MGALNKILSKTIIKIVKNSTKLDLAVENLIGEFGGKCPSKDKLIPIIKRKNQLKLALNSIIEVLPKIDKTADIADGIVTASKIAVNVLKITPTPPFAPSGLIASNLDKIDKLLDETGDVLDAVDKIIPPILDTFQLIINKLDTIDNLIDKCVGDLTDEEKQELSNDIIEIKSFGGDIEGDNLEDRLNPKSSNPYLYKKTNFTSSDWQFIIETNADNDFTFPQRRVKAININKDNNNIYKGVVVYNTSDGKYSYSNSIEVLIEETKFSVEQLNDKLYQIQ